MDEEVETYGFDSEGNWIIGEQYHVSRIEFTVGANFSPLSRFGPCKKFSENAKEVKN